MPTENQTVDNQYDAGDMADQAAKAFRDGKAAAEGYDAADMASNAANGFREGAKELERVTAERDAALADASRLREALKPFADCAEHALPAVLFDGFAVYQSLSDKGKCRTSAENVSDVLDAVVSIIRSEQQAEVKP